MLNISRGIVFFVKQSASNNFEEYRRIIIFSSYSQSALLLFSFYSRLYYIFINTPFQLSRCTNITYSILFIISPIYLIATLFGSFLISPKVCEYSGYILFFLILIITISLTSIFISKLLQVYKSTNRDDDLIKVISKNNYFSIYIRNIYINFTIFMFNW